VAPPPEEPVKPARRQMHSGFFPGQPGFGGFSMNSRHALDGTDLQRVVAERDAEARRAAAARAADAPSDTAEQTQQAAVAAPAPRVVRPLFMHDGADLVAPTGTPVYAASDGVVIGAAPNGGYGNWIRIDHQGKLSTVYGHLSSFAPGIQEGARVSQGELIGFVGNTGRSTGAHLHFEILSNGKAVDPLAYPEIKRAQLRGADLERFRKQEKRALAERDRETVLALSTSGF
jgi:murein DD-endopeptidase MepM/ murein hydrolase activator NlpD